MIEAIAGLGVGAVFVAGFTPVVLETALSAMRSRAGWRLQQARLTDRRRDTAGSARGRS